MGWALFWAVLSLWTWNTSKDHFAAGKNVRAWIAIAMSATDAAVAAVYLF